MGIGAQSQKVLRDLVPKLPIGFSVCELGDQMYATKPRRDRKDSWERKHAEPFYRGLGCGSYSSIDANGRATILADLNLPLPADIPAFDLVTNWGTTEHVFDQAQCWRSIHQLAKVGGYIAFEQPWQGYEDHGLYNLQPTFFRDLARHNDYRIEHFDCPPTKRGRLVRAVLQRMSDLPFRVPTQDKYRKRLKV